MLRYNQFSTEGLLMKLISSNLLFILTLLGLTSCGPSILKITSHLKEDKAEKTEECCDGDYKVGGLKK